MSNDIFAHRVNEDHGRTEYYLEEFPFIFLCLAKPDGTLFPGLVRDGGHLFIFSWIVVRMIGEDAGCVQFGREAVMHQGQPYLLVNRNLLRSLRQHGRTGVTGDLWTRLALWLDRAERMIAIWHRATTGNLDSKRYILRDESPEDALKEIAQEQRPGDMRVVLEMDDGETLADAEEHSTVTKHGVTDNDDGYEVEITWTPVQDLRVSEDQMLVLYEGVRT